MDIEDRDRDQKDGVDQDRELTGTRSGGDGDGDDDDIDIDVSSEESDEDDGDGNVNNQSIGESNGHPKVSSWVSLNQSSSIQEPYALQKKRGRPRKNPFPDTSLNASVSREHERVRWNKKGTAAFIKFVMRYLKTFAEDPQANQKAFYQRLSGVLSKHIDDEEYQPIPKNEDNSVLTEIQIGGKLRQLMDSQRKLVLDNSDKLVDIAKSFTSLNWDLTIIIVNIDEAIGRRRDLGVEKTSILGLLKELINFGIENGDVNAESISSLKPEGNGIGEQSKDYESSGGDERDNLVSRKRQRLDSISTKSVGYSINKFRVDSASQNGDSEFQSKGYEDSLKQSLETTSRICESFNKTILMINNNQQKEKVINIKEQIKNELKEEIIEEVRNKFKNELKLELLNDLRMELKNQLSQEITMFRSEIIKDEVSKILHELTNKLLAGK